MEIRRKVFSLLEDENGEERYYSTTEFEMEFDEETGEKLFSEKEEKKGSKAAKIAGAATAGVAGTAAAAYGGGKAFNAIMQKKYDALKAAGDTEGVAKLDASKLGKANKAVADAVRDVESKAKDAYHYVGEKAGRGYYWVKDKTGEWVKVSGKALREAGTWVANTAKKGGEAVANAAKKGWDKSSEAVGKGVEWAGKHKGAAIGIGLGAAAVGTGATLGAKALKKKKESKK